MLAISALDCFAIILFMFLVAILRRWQANYIEENDDAAGGFISLQRVLFHTCPPISPAQLKLLCVPVTTQVIPLVHCDVLMSSRTGE